MQLEVDHKERYEVLTTASMKMTVRRRHLQAEYGSNICLRIKFWCPTLNGASQYEHHVVWSMSN
jgi:hypothetical protein